MVSETPPSSTRKYSGSKFSLIIFAITLLVADAISLGLRTTVFPAAIAAITGPKDNKYG